MLKIANCTISVIGAVSFIIAQYLWVIKCFQDGDQLIVDSCYKLNPSIFTSIISSAPGIIMCALTFIINKKSQLILLLVPNLAIFVLGFLLFFETNVHSKEDVFGGAWLISIAILIICGAALLVYVFASKAISIIKKLLGSI